MASTRASSAFELLQPAVREWIWAQGWSSLHDIQESTIPTILAGQRDVVISAATAGGKTEAAFLPIASALSSGEGTDKPGLQALCISPLKALINDQARRLEDLFSAVSVSVHRWHGDVSSSRKKKLMKTPSGVLLITPESLEAIFIRQGPKLGLLLGALRYLVIDELHAFIGSERGKQLQSLLHRVEHLVGRRVPRIALSATLGDLDIAADFMRPGEGPAVHRVTSPGGGQEVRVQVRTYLLERVKDEVGVDEAAPAVVLGQGEPTRPLHEDLFNLYRGGHHLVFANRRSDVEVYTDRLRGLSEARRLPIEFWPHHGSLSRDLREEAEDALRAGDRPATVLATSTLELGIDIGRVETVGQIGPPHSVAALRQRLGRSGRRGEPAQLRVFVTEAETSPSSPPEDRLHVGLVQAIAVVELLAQSWFEPPTAGALHLSTLVQQVLSMIAEKGGLRASQAYSELCTHGAFREVRPEQFGQLLRDLGASELIRQLHTDELVLDLPGEHLVNHYDFFAAFQSSEEFRVVAKERTLGSLPVVFPLVIGTYLLFAGKRWRIEHVDERRKVVYLRPAPGGRAPSFDGGGATIHDRVREVMQEVYSSESLPAYADGPSRTALTDARASFHELGLPESGLIQDGRDTLVFPWKGTRVMNTLLCWLGLEGFDVGLERVSLRVTDTKRERLRFRLREILEDTLPSAADLAQKVPNTLQEKHHSFLSEGLLAADYASSQLDVLGAREAMALLLQ